MLLSKENYAPFLPFLDFFCLGPLGGGSENIDFGRTSVMNTLPRNKLKNQLIQFLKFHCMGYEIKLNH